MPNYLLAYRSAKNGRPDGDEHFGAWQTFFEGLGASLVDAGNPIFGRRSLGDCDTDTTVLGGYSIISADNLEAAVALAEACPGLSSAGGVDVGEITPLSPESITTTVDDHAKATGLAHQSS